MNKLALATVLAITFTSITAPRVTAADSPALETLVVRAAREPIAAEASGSAVSVIGAELLANRQNAALGEILRSVPGVAVSRSGQFGAQTQLRMRGGEANHVLVFIDGVKVNDPAQNNEFNMAHMLNYDLESVEVIRGPQSALWGSDALSGVINITTRRGADGFNADAFAEGGSDGWQHYGATGSYGDQRWQANLSANRVDTDGDNASRQGSEDDGYENNSFNGSGSYQFNEQLLLESNLRYVDSTTQFDGVDFSTGLPADSRDESDSEQWYGRLAARLDTLDGRWQHTLSASYVDVDNKNHTENAFAASGFDDYNTDANNTTLLYQSTFEVVPGHSLTGAYEHQQEDFKQRGPIGFGDPNRDEDLDADSYIVEYRGDLSASLSLLASVRHDDNSDFDDKTTGRVSGSWRINDGATRLRGAWGKGVKNPTFTERFGFYTDFIGNPNLKPEESEGWEVGVDQRLLGDHLQLGLTWFDEQLDDEINGFVYDPASGGFTADNENGSSDRQGLEFSGSWLLADGLSLSAAYTYLDASEDDGSDEIRRPEHSGSANLNWDFLNKRANLNLNVDYNGEQDDFFFPPLPPYEERVQLDDFTLVTLAGSYRLLANLRLFARVENALDEDYEEVYGYRTPGRSVYAGLSYNFAR
ncbi:MAG: TonB-dependent receptor [Halieaceae bacterium]